MSCTHSSMFKKNGRCYRCEPLEVKKPKRSIKRARTVEERGIKFIERAKEVHGDTYDYSKVDYVNSKTKVIIVCKEHGEFTQRPSDNVMGQGCPTCANGVRNNKSKHTTEQFIEKAKEVHGDTYDYSKVDYVTAKTKVIIVCKEHGEFEQLPYSHITGAGCLICANGIRNNKSKHTTEQFIEKAKEVHGDTYDYSKVDYVNNSTKVIIICKEHGEFEQIPKHHLKGSGCPVCADNRYLDKPTILYYIKVEHKGLIGYKIGITTRDTLARYAQDTSSGTKITILDEVMYETGKPAYTKEQEIIKQYKQYIHPQGESMLYSGAKELFDRDVLGGTLNE